MLKNILLSLLLLILSTRTIAQTETNVKTIFDSLEVLKRAGGLVDGYSANPTAEESRYHKIGMMLFELPLPEARKLLLDKDKYSKTYGFSILLIRYFDSLTKRDCSIFSDTAKLLIYTQDGNIDAGITVGQYCEMAYTSTIEKNKLVAKKKDVISAVEKFISTHALYPDSYQPHEFLYYTWGGEEDGLYFEIQHEYTLKQTDGKKVEATDYFILDHRFQIMLIETTRSYTVIADPPRLGEWMNKFGKAN